MRYYSYTQKRLKETTEDMTDELKGFRTRKDGTFRTQIEKIYLFRAIFYNITYQT